MVPTCADKRLRLWQGCLLSGRAGHIVGALKAPAAASICDVCIEIYGQATNTWHACEAVCMGAHKPPAGGSGLRLGLKLGLGFGLGLGL